MSFKQTEDEVLVSPDAVIKKDDNPVLGLFAWKDTCLISHGAHCIQVWDLRTGTARHQLDVVSNSVRLFGSLLVVVDAAKPVVYSYNVEDLSQEPRTFVGHEKWVTSTLVVSVGHPPKQRLLTASADHTARSFPVPHPSNHSTDNIEAVAVFEGHTDYVNEVLCYEDHVFTASCDTTIKEWNAHKGSLLRTFAGHTGWIFSIGVHEGSLFSASKDGTVRQWDLRSGSTSKVFDVESTALDLRFAPGVVYVADSYHRLTKWMLKNGKQLCTMDGHSGKLSNITLCGENEIITSSKDNSIRKWNANRGRCLAIFRGHEKAVNGFVLMGGILYSGSDDGTIRKWILPVADTEGPTALPQDPRMRAIIKCQAVVRRWLVRNTMSKVSSHFKGAQQRWVALQQLIKLERNFSKSTASAVWAYRAPIQQYISPSEGEDPGSSVALMSLFKLFDKCLMVHENIIQGLQELTKDWPFIGGAGAVYAQYASDLLNVYNSLSTSHMAAMRVLTDLEGDEDWDMIIQQGTMSTGLSFSQLVERAMDHPSQVLPPIKALLKATLTSVDDYAPLSSSLSLMSLLASQCSRQRLIDRNAILLEVTMPKIKFAQGQKLPENPKREFVKSGTALWSGRKREIVLLSDTMLVCKERVVKEAELALASPATFKRARPRRKGKTVLLDVEELVSLKEVSVKKSGMSARITTPVATSVNDKGEPVFSNTLESADSSSFEEWTSAIELWRARNKRGVFDVPLQRVLKREDTNVPLLVASIATYIEEAAKGTLQDVLLSPVEDTTAARRGFIDRPPKLTGSHSDLLWVLMEWLRLLPKPMLTEDQFLRCIAAAAKPSTIKQVLSGLPPQTHDLLNYVSYFLHDISIRSVSRRPTVHLAACVFGPLLLRCSSHGLLWMDGNFDGIVDVAKELIYDPESCLGPRVQHRKHLLPSYLVSKGNSGLVEASSSDPGPFAGAIGGSSGDGDSKPEAGKAVGLFELLGMTEEEAGSPSPSAKAKGRGSRVPRLPTSTVPSTTNVQPANRMTHLLDPSPISGSSNSMSGTKPSSKSSSRPTTPPSSSSPPSGRSSPFNKKGRIAGLSRSSTGLNRSRQSTGLDDASSHARGYIQIKIQGHPKYKSFKKRWLVLSPSHLYVFKDHKESQEVDSMDLRLTTVDAASSASHFLASAFGNTWDVNASSVTKCKLWKAKIGSAKAALTGSRVASPAMSRMLSQSSGAPVSLSAGASPVSSPATEKRGGTKKAGNGSPPALRHSTSSPATSSTFVRAVSQQASGSPETGGSARTGPPMGARGPVKVLKTTSSGKKKPSSKPPTPSMTRSPSAAVIHPTGFVLIAKFNFVPRNVDEIPLTRGHVVQLVQPALEGEGWWAGCCEGRVGKFPANFVTPAPPEVAERLMKEEDAAKEARKG